MLPTIRLSPHGSPFIRKYTKPFNAFKRCGMYPNVSKCNAKRCICCTHLCTKTTITSSVNSRRFSIIDNNNMDWTSSDLIYVITWTKINCGMQYVGQTGRSPKTRFPEHFRKMKKHKKLTHFFIDISKNNGHSPSKILIQPVEKSYIYWPALPTQNASGIRGLAKIFVPIRGYGRHSP